MQIIGFSDEYRFIEDLAEDIILNAIPTEKDIALSSQNKYVLRCYFPDGSGYNVEYIDMFIVHPNGNYVRILEEDLDDTIWDLAYDWCLLHRNLCIERLGKLTINHHL